MAAGPAMQLLHFLDGVYVVVSTEDMLIEIIPSRHAPGEFIFNLCSSNELERSRLPP